ncbi:unnamed protein product, partial [Effrenium voratum]
RDADRHRGAARRQSSLHLRQSSVQRRHHCRLRLPDGLPPQGLLRLWLRGAHLRGRCQGLPAGGQAELCAGHQAPAAPQRRIQQEAEHLRPHAVLQLPQPAPERAWGRRGVGGPGEHPLRHRGRLLRLRGQGEGGPEEPHPRVQVGARRAAHGHHLPLRERRGHLLPGLQDHTR